MVKHFTFAVENTKPVHYFNIAQILLYLLQFYDCESQFRYIKQQMKILIWHFQCFEEFIPNTTKQERAKLLFKSISQTQARITQMYTNIYSSNNYDNIAFVALNQETRNDKLYLRWKNLAMFKSVKCNYCGKHCNQQQLRTCRRCKQAYYCDKICQKKDWSKNNHSRMCVQKQSGK